MNTKYLNYDSLFSAYDEYIQEFINAGLHVEKDIKSFTAFLKYNQLSTIHAEELFAVYQDPTAQIKVSKHDFKLRKQHAKRDALIKKILIPSAVVGSLVGGVAGAVGASGLVAGSTMFGIIPVTSSFLTNFISAAIPGFAIGAVATTGVILSKNYLTRLYYKSKYGSAQKSINDLNNGIDYEDIAIAKLIKKVEATNQKIMDLKAKSSTGFLSTLVTPFKAIRRNTLNVINRNRIHHLEAFSKDLVEKFGIIENSEGTAKEKLEELEPIYLLMQKIETFIQNDIQSSKLFNLLTCKEKNNHIHKDFIENLDIYSKLAMYLETVDIPSPSTKAEKKARKEQQKTYKIIKNNIGNQNAVAERLLNGENLLQRCTKRHKALETNAATKKQVRNYILKDNSVVIVFDDDSQQNLSNVENPENIQLVEAVGKKIIITYTDGTTVEQNITSNRVNVKSPILTEKTILRAFGDQNFIDGLKDAGFTDEKIAEFESELSKRLGGNKKPKKLAGTPTFKEFAEIYVASVNIIEKTKGLNC